MKKSEIFITIVGFILTAVGLSNILDTGTLLIVLILLVLVLITAEVLDRLPDICKYPGSRNGGSFLKKEAGVWVIMGALLGVIYGIIGTDMLGIKGLGKMLGFSVGGIVGTVIGVLLEKYFEK